ncbi:methyltransferase domain-containing protein, partial [Streptomyces albiflaviniger]|nr:methyltransferase domain-containing protein [Streptomyces albiflaviniger]
MSVSEPYRQAWESYWRETSDAPGDAIWDADPSLSAAPHLDLLAPHADTSLPIVDLGCGNGTQTRYLAARFGRALGVDLSQAAVEHARRAD